MASTGNSGHALINGTGTILSYTTPNDGQLHPIVVTFAIDLGGGGTTGGTIAQGASGQTLADGITMALASGFIFATEAGGIPVAVSLPANTTFDISQTEALTAGSATAYIQILSA